MEPQCSYRLLTLLFSETIAEGLLQLGNVADQAALDGEKVANNQLFWEGVQEASKGQDKAYNNLHFVDDASNLIVLHIYLISYLKTFFNE